MFQRWRMLIGLYCLWLSCLSAVVAEDRRPVGSVDDLLVEKIDFVAETGSFQEMLDALETHIGKRHPKSGFRIEIIGKDLELEGITRNKRVKAIDAKGASVADLLTRLTREANPSAGVEDLTSDKQKLVWVVADDRDEEAVVLITTRKAALAKKYRLRAPFINPVIQ